MADLQSRLGEQVLALVHSAGRVAPGQLTHRQGKMHLHLNGVVILVEVSVTLCGITVPLEPCEEMKSAILRASMAFQEKEYPEDPTSGRLSRLEIDE